jgi:AraC-like DNA-binding protein
VKPVLRQITSTPEQSFLVRKDKGPEMLNDWHYHPEIELLFIKRSSGTWLIGDHIGNFKSGDVVLLGANLPHCFRHEYTHVAKEDNEAGETICVKFDSLIFGPHFLALPETKPIERLLSKCDIGLQLTGKIRKSVRDNILKMLTASPGRKMIFLLSLLEKIARSKELIPLSSKGFTLSREDTDREKIKTIFHYTFNNYHRKIKLEEVSRQLNMTRESFCRYFKKTTNKTYIRFLMEVRIGYACRLLAEDEKNVSEICYECGYNNISNFNQQFKLITAKRPLEYKRDYLKKDSFGR